MFSILDGVYVCSYVDLAKGVCCVNLLAVCGKELCQEDETVNFIYLCFFVALSILYIYLFFQGKRNGNINKFLFFLNKEIYYIMCPKMIT